MKKLMILCAAISFSAVLHAQVPEDVLKYSWQPVNGTARISAIGGAMGSLGGDISATFTNPAGLAFFKTTDLVLSPGYSFLKNKSNFRGTGANDKDNYFNMGTSGIVGGWQGAGNWTNKTLSLAVTRTANFSNKIYYRGQNDFSSYGEQYATEAANSGMTIDQILNSNDISLGTRMALYSFFLDTTTLAGNSTPDFVSAAMYNHLKNGSALLLNQAHTIETSGGVTEIALGYAANMDDKFYIGGSLGIPIVRYQKTSIFREEDATSVTNNYFGFSELSESSSTKGAGINAKLGVIVKPSEYLRLGLAIHSPTWYTMTDSYNAMMTVNVENLRSNPATTIVHATDFTNGVVPEYKYELISPWRVMLSGSYVLRQIEDVRKQKGFITADIEYVGYRSNRFRNAEDYDDNGYYDEVNNAIKNYYKNAFNFRLGGELKFNTLMARLGFAYYGNPYKDKELKAHKMYLSGGFGYRHAGMYVDLTYVQGLTKDVNFPYRLSDKANTFANTKGAAGNLILTLGFKI